MPQPRKFYVTTPIYYVNDKPHIGHAYTTILADVLARYHRLQDVPTFFLTGTDEHGMKVQRAAEANGISPQEQCDRTVVRFLELWKKLDITYDDFIRTTEPRHVRVVQKILQDLYDADEIYQDDYEGWYCVPCERFFTEKDLVDGNCPECGRAVERLVEKNWFFRMSRYQDWLIRYIENHPECIRPEHRRQETLGFLQRPLNDLCISRPKSRLSWGIELPFDRDYVTYVWFDALINYISAVGYGFDDALFATWWPATVHLIGKDILTTHTVYWPIMLKAMGVEPPESVFAHGWWLVGRDKMSKSLGNVVNPMDMVDRFGPDAFRYFLMAEMTLGQDASFTEQAFVTRYNADLANDLGNLVSRVLKMIARHADGRIPPRAEPGEAEQEMLDTALNAAGSMPDFVERMQLDRGIAAVLAAVRAGNRYFEREAPWRLAQNGNHERLNHVLYSAAELLRITSGLLYPVMPGKMTELRRGLGFMDDEISPRIGDLQQWGGLQPQRAITPIGALFPRARREKPAGAAAGAGGKKPAPEAARREKKKPHPTPEKAEVVRFAEFAQIDLRTAKILSAEPVEGADRLLKLRIDLGDHQRTIVAGIAKHYRPEDLPGRTIIVVANLEPARIRGVESQGMLLAASSGDTMRLLTIDGDLPPGSPVS